MIITLKGFEEVICGHSFSNKLISDDLVYNLCMSYRWINWVDMRVFKMNMSFFQLSQIWINGTCWWYSYILFWTVYRNLFKVIQKFVDDIVHFQDMYIWLCAIRLWIFFLSSSFLKTITSLQVKLALSNFSSGPPSI